MAVEKVLSTYWGHSFRYQVRKAMEDEPNGSQWFFIWQAIVNGGVVLSPSNFKKTVMDNLKRPAQPQSLAANPQTGGFEVTWGIHEDFAGFTKLELASLHTLQGLLASNQFASYMDSEHPHIATSAVSLAKAVLEEANK